MRIAQQPGFILHTRPWRETSLLVDALTRDFGRIALVARGVSTPKKQSLRAALQPMQSVYLDFQLSGELGQLRVAEAADAAPALRGDAILASLYVHELLLRLLPKHDKVAEVHALYGLLRERLRASEDLAWTLRRFERDLLQALGFGVDFTCDVDGVPIAPAASYRLIAEHGFVRLGDQAKQRGYIGAGVLALAHDELGPDVPLAELRHLLRECIEPHLAGRELKSWGLIPQLSVLKHSS